MSGSTAGEPAELDALVERLTTLGLTEWPHLISLDANNVDTICAMAPFTGLTCLLGAAIEQGLVRVDPSAAERVEDAWVRALARAVRLDTVLVEVAARLDDAGVPLRVLKGVAVASIDEPDPSWRSYGDVDVLVPPERFLEAVDVLAEAGCRPAVDPVGWGWIARHGKSLTLIHPSGAQIDLHRQLAIGPFGARLRAADLFELGRPFTVGGRPLLALADVHRFAHACYHAMLGGTRGPRHRRDVLLLAAAVTPRQFEDEAVRGWSCAVVASALGWADPELRVVSPAWGSWLSTESLSEDDERLLRAYRGSFRTVALAELGDRPGMLSKVAYAASLVWPSRANLAARNRRRRDHLAELVRAVPPLFRRGTGGRD